MQADLFSHILSPLVREGGRETGSRAGVLSLCAITVSA